MIDALLSLGTSLFVSLFAGVMLLFAAATATVAIAVPALADFSLVLAAVFAPLCLAFYPVSKTWAYNCLNTAVHAAMVSVATSLLLQILLGRDGVMQAAVNAAKAGMSTGRTFEPVIACMLGMIVFYMLTIYILTHISSIVASIFGGFAMNPQLPQSGAKAAGAAGTAAKGAAAVGVTAARAIAGRMSGAGSKNDDGGAGGGSSFGTPTSTGQQASQARFLNSINSGQTPAKPPQPTKP